MGVAYSFMPLLQRFRSSTDATIKLSNLFPCNQRILNRLNLYLNRHSLKNREPNYAPHLAPAGLILISPKVYLLASVGEFHSWVASKFYA